MQQGSENRQVIFKKDGRLRLPLISSIETFLVCLISSHVVVFLKRQMILIGTQLTRNSQ